MEEKDTPAWNISEVIGSNAHMVVVGHNYKYMHINHMKAISILSCKFIQYCVMASAKRLRHSKCQLFSAQKPIRSPISFETAIYLESMSRLSSGLFNFLSCH